MEKYEEIYNYLQTFPSNTTVGTLIANMDKAENEFIENRKKRVRELKEEFVGNAYYYEEVDDDEVVCKYVTYVKEFNKKSIKDIAFVCDLIAITNYDVHYEENATVDIKGLKMAKKVSKEIFDSAKEKFNALRDFEAYC